MTDPIRAALDAAGRALCFGQNGIDCDTCMTADQCRKPGHWNTEAANTIAAFLRALSPDVTFQFRSGEHRTALDAFADAVLAAAKEERE
jgi:hypothetical protein